MSRRKLSATAAAWVPPSSKLNPSAKAWTPSGAYSSDFKRWQRTPPRRQRQQSEAERKRKAEERRRKQEAEIAERKRKEEEERKRKEEERTRQEEEERKRKEEEERKRQEEEERKRQEEEERKRKEEERKRKEEEERKRKEEEERKRKEEEERKRKEEEERKRQEEEERKRQEEEERKRQEEEERKRQEEEERKRQEEEEEQRKEEQRKSVESRKYSRSFLLKYEGVYTGAPQGIDPTFLSRLAGKSRKPAGKGPSQWRMSNPARQPRRPNTNQRDGYNNNNHRRRNNDRRGHNRGRGRGRDNRRNKFSAPMDIEIKALEHSENAYKVAQKVNLEEEQVLQRKVNSLLNKLTPEKFDVLCKQYFKFPINTLARLRFVADAIFEKALIMKLACPTYADFCKLLFRKSPEFLEGGVTRTFKKLLLNRCQTEFERDHAQDQKVLDSLETEDEKLEFHIKAKQRRLGTIAFIGELFCRALIGKRIIYVCFNVLLNLQNPDEENIEALCKLFATIGKALWAKEKRSKPHARHGQTTLDKTHGLVKQNKITQARIKFLIQDTVEMSRRGWTQRMKTVKAKKISEIHAESEAAQRAAEEQSRRNARRAYDRGGYYQQQPRVQKVYRNNTRRKPRNVDAGGWEQQSTRNVRSRVPPAAQVSLRGGRGGGRRGGLRSSGGYGGRGRRGGRDQAAPQEPLSRASAFDALAASDSDSASSASPSPKISQPSPRANPAPFSLSGPAIPEATAHEKAGKAAEKAEEPLTREQEQKITKLIKSLLEEYFCANDLSEAKLCVSELQSTQLHNKIVYEGMALGLEKKEREQKMLCTLWSALIADGVLTAKHVVAGLDEMMEWADDFAPDYPRMWAIMGTWLAGLILAQPRPISLGYLNSANALKLVRGRAKTTLNTLKSLLAASDQQTVASIVAQDSDLDFSVLGVTADQLAEQGLSFLSS